MPTNTAIDYTEEDVAYHKARLSADQLEIFNCFESKLRDYQRDDLFRTLTYFRNNDHKNAGIEIPTATGKSVIITGVCMYLAFVGQKILVVQPNLTLRDQITKNFIKVRGWLEEDGHNWVTEMVVTVQDVSADGDGEVQPQTG